MVRCSDFCSSLLNTGTCGHGPGSEQIEDHLIIKNINKRLRPQNGNIFTKVNIKTQNMDNT